MGYELFLKQSRVEEEEEEREHRRGVYKEDRRRHFKISIFKTEMRMRVCVFIFRGIFFFFWFVWGFVISGNFLEFEAQSAKSLNYFESQIWRRAWKLEISSKARLRLDFKLF